MFRRPRSRFDSPSLQANVGGGTYARKQLLSSVPLIAWSHRSRFQSALELAHQLAPHSLLDYGCGDGTFLGVLMDSSSHPRAAVGADGDTAVADCRARLGNIPGLEFDSLADLGSRRFDVVFCMEVLEHVVRPETVLDELEELLAPRGHLVISVPVETGPTLLVKQVARRLAGWAGIGDYAWTHAYSWGQLARGLTALHAGCYMDRPTHDGPFGPAHDHTGFNWRHLRRLLQGRFDLVNEFGTPRQLPMGLGSQVWFVARRKFEPI